MIPGLIGPPFPAEAKVGALVAIASSQKPTVPVAVGVCEVDVGALEKAVGEKGRAVRVLHWVGDEVYKHGGSPAKVPEVLEVQGADGEAELVEGVKDMEITDVPVKKEERDGSSDGEEEVRQLETKEIDDAFYNAALYGFSDYSEKSSTLEFPLSSSAFISQIVHPYLPPASHFPPHNYLQTQGPHPSLQLKKTSWKNTAKFLKHLHGKELVMTKVRNGGETVVMNINWDHNAVQAFTPYKLPKAPKEEKSLDSSEKGGMVKVEALYRPNGKGIKFFEECKAGLVSLAPILPD
jgi:translation initiation factor 2D